jgi:two-component system KDP operon response regulator KdpE
MSAPILIVEDDQLLRTAVRLLLEDSGYHVHEAATGAAALAGAAQRPAAILLDLGLPDLPGLEVVRRLVADPVTRDIPIVALTGRAGKLEQKQAIDAGCRDYLVKPVPAARLLDCIAGIVAPA